MKPTIAQVLMSTCAKAMADAFQKLNKFSSELSTHIKNETRNFYGRFSDSNEKTDLLEFAEEVERVNKIQPTYAFRNHKNEEAKKDLNKVLRYKDFDNFANAQKTV